MTITLWSLFERPRNSRGRWMRVSPYAYARKTAIIVFQDRLIASALSGGPTELRLRRIV